MRSTLAIFGILIALTGCSWWASLGANKGWTKTSVAIEKIDEITEIPYVDYEKKFVPGIEFPVAFVGIGGLMVVLGWWKTRKNS